MRDDENIESGRTSILRGAYDSVAGTHVGYGFPGTERVERNGADFAFLRDDLCGTNRYGGGRHSVSEMV